MKFRFSLIYQEIEELCQLRWGATSLLDNIFCERKKKVHSSWCMDKT